jgi:hypothetical protein
LSFSSEINEHKQTKSLQLQEKYQISRDEKIQVNSRKIKKSATSGRIPGEKYGIP